MTASSLLRDLKALRDPAKAAFFPRFFRTGKGEYGEGDRFIGVTVPQVHAVAARYRDMLPKELERLLASPWHEARLSALIILTDRYERGNAQARRSVVKFYLSHLDGVNNWDLVDASAAKILGASLMGKHTGILDRFARSRSLWKQRIAIVATQAFIREGDVSVTFRIADLLLDHPHDLIHKAVGWMLREAGKKDRQALIQFLDTHAAAMPRTMLRYAIEKFDAATRKQYLRQRGRRIS